MREPAGQPRYKRVLLKISGEALMGGLNYGHDYETVQRLCGEILKVHEMGVEICLVVGGGNIFRGVSGSLTGMERGSADYIGMLATVINALTLQNELERLGVQTRVLSAIPMTSICEPYIRRRALRHMERGRIVIFAAGTGNPFFTTDTASALRATEMGCQALLKATKVDGVYSADPFKDKNAVRFDHLTYMDVLTKQLNVMDASAITLTRDNNIPIIVFCIHEDNAFSNVIRGKGTFTLVDGVSQ